MSRLWDIPVPGTRIWLILSRNAPECRAIMRFSEKGPTNPDCEPQSIHTLLLECVSVCHHPIKVHTIITDYILYNNACAILITFSFPPAEFPAYIHNSHIVYATYSERIRRAINHPNMKQFCTVFSRADSGEIPSEI